MTQSASALALLDQPLDRALGEVADQPVDRDAPALDHHPGLAGRDERRAIAAGHGRPRQLERDRHLADRAVAADGQDHPLARRVAAPDGRLHPLGRAPVVDDRRAARRRGCDELRVVADERVEPGPDVEPGRDRLEDDRPPRRRAGVPPVGAIPISSASGGCGRASASASVATIGMSCPAR